MFYNHQNQVQMRKIIEVEDKMTALETKAKEIVDTHVLGLVSEQRQEDYCDAVANIVVEPLSGTHHHKGPYHGCRKKYYLYQKKYYFCRVKLRAEMISLCATRNYTARAV
jgi:hypothetical protein